MLSDVRSIYCCLTLPWWFGEYHVFCQSPLHIVFSSQCLRDIGREGAEREGTFFGFFILKIVLSSALLHSLFATLKSHQEHL